MIHYTPLSELDIFPNEEKKESVMFHQSKNCHVKCRDTEGGRKQIVQVLSTDPAHYMDPSLQPGQWLDS
ncbi:YlzJ-like family protein [Halobacillus yeomjeoni]|uniref:YlzJ-like family protein n=1 Tax=Halobacillus yeomjeoni TaxID=311194 RepID=A0A931HTM1_9BACI|nr:YlzJ-like family protein [Halobacillus yeomjeoni]MBH0229330.1 YlzJ-like family protein [Halobacillus yeomjeoni]